MNYKIHNGDNIEVLKKYPDNHFDSIVTDPPYGISFLGKDWDKHTGEVETWKECLRVLKPGGHMIAFSAARTYHRLASNIEDCGFEIRDQLMWIYLSGFPKAQDIGKNIDKRAGKLDKNYGTTAHSITSTEGKGHKGQICKVCNKVVSGPQVKECKEDPCGMRYEYQTEDGKKWAGWKTALKPSHEPIVLARKPMKQSCIDNVVEHGTGALNIEDSRIPYEDEADAEYIKNDRDRPMAVMMEHYQKLDGTMKAGEQVTQKEGNLSEYGSSEGRYPSNVIGELPDYQKYFICPKVSRKERHIGFDVSEYEGNELTIEEEVECQTYVSAVNLVK